MQRGVGICRTPDCRDYNKDVLLLENVPAKYICRQCMRHGITSREMGSCLSPTNMEFFQVRVEFNFHPVPGEWEGKYRSLVIVTDETMRKDGNVYTLRSPLIRTEKRALEVATALLANLMTDPESALISENGMRPKVHFIDFDRPLDDVKAQLAVLGNKLSSSRLTERYSEIK